jgi:molybdenum cofactor biosynthesis enzyme MoaA
MATDNAAYSDRTSTTPRRRTRCIYCGTRIHGAAPRHLSSNEMKAIRRYAERLACRKHWRLVLVDPELEYAVERL